MAERPSTCHPHVERERYKVTCMCCGSLVSSVAARGGTGWVKMAVTGVETRRCFAGPQDLLTFRHAICYYGGMLRNSMFLYSIPRDLPELWRRYFVANSEIDCDLLQRVWAEMNYRLDVCRVTMGGHLQHLWGMQKKYLCCPSVSRMLQSFPPFKFKCTDFMKCVRE